MLAACGGQLTGTAGLPARARACGWDASHDPLDASGTPRAAGSPGCADPNSPRRCLALRRTGAGRPWDRAKRPPGSTTRCLTGHCSTTLTSCRRCPDALPAAGSFELRPLRGRGSPQTPGTPLGRSKASAKDAELLASDFLPPPRFRPPGSPAQANHLSRGSPRVTARDRRPNRAPARMAAGLKIGLDEHSKLAIYEPPYGIEP